MSIFVIDYLVKKIFWHWHVAIRDFWRLVTVLRLRGAMVRASAFHALACCFNSRYCISVRQCSSMVTVLPDQVELHPSQFSLAKATGKDVEDTSECEVPVTSWVPYYRFFAQTCPDVCCFTIWFFFVRKVFWQTPESKLFSRCSITNFVNAKLKLKSLTTRVVDS